MHTVHEMHSLIIEQEPVDGPLFCTSVPFQGLDKFPDLLVFSAEDLHFRALTSFRKRKLEPMLQRYEILKMDDAKNTVRKK